MKKWLSMILVLVLAMALIGCVSPSNETTAATEPSVTEEEEVYPTVTIELPTEPEVVEK